MAYPGTPVQELFPIRRPGNGPPGLRARQEKFTRKSPGKSSKIYTTKILRHISADWPGQHFLLFLRRIMLNKTTTHTDFTEAGWAARVGRIAWQIFCYLWPLDIFENPYGPPRPTESENPPATKKSGTDMTGRPGYRTMEMIGGSSAPYLARTPCVPLFCTSFNRVGNKERFRLPGAGGGSFPLYGGTFARSYAVSKKKFQKKPKTPLVPQK